MLIKVVGRCCRVHLAWWQFLCRQDVQALLCSSWKVNNASIITGFTDGPPYYFITLLPLGDECSAEPHFVITSKCVTIKRTSCARLVFYFLKKNETTLRKI